MDEREIAVRERYMIIKKNEKDNKERERERDGRESKNRDDSKKIWEKERLLKEMMRAKVKSKKKI